MQTTAAVQQAQDEPGWLAPATFVGILLILVVIFAQLPSSDGPFQDMSGNLDGAQVRPGVPFTYAGIPLTNVGSLPVSLISATLGPHTSGVHLLGECDHRAVAILARGVGATPSQIGG